MLYIYTRIYLWIYLSIYIHIVVYKSTYIYTHLYTVPKACSKKAHRTGICRSVLYVIYIYEFSFTYKHKCFYLTSSMLKGSPT